jgi:hypothetical protein
MIIKSFRGLLKDGSIEKINLSTNDGRTGYRIVKLALFHAEPGENSAEHTVKIYSVPQTVADNSVDFSDQTLLAVAHLADHSDVANPLDHYVVFDNATFNQDIYVTHVDTRGSEPCNYYFELEQFELSLNEQTVATLQDIRNVGV